MVVQIVQAGQMGVWSGVSVQMDMALFFCSFSLPAGNGLAHQA